MQILESETEKLALNTRILLNKSEIIKYIHLGISIPILPQFHKYISDDLDIYDAKDIILEEKVEQKNFGKKTDEIAGITLVYHDDTDILYFGFFGVYDNDVEKIDFLINDLIKYAIERNYKYIRGPINIPTMIYGWGFMAKGSKKDLFIGSPINPPIYQEIFFKKGFKVLFQEDRYEMPALRMDPHKVEKLINLGINSWNYKENIFDTGDYEYEYINPGKEGMMKVKEEFLELNAKYMPPSAQITPKKSSGFDSLIDFIFKYGADWMIWIVRHKKTNQMVANGYVIPDIFSNNKKGELNSISFHAWVVHPEHRRNYLAMIMYGFTSLLGINRKTPHYINRGSWPVGAENIANGNAAKKMGGKKDRSHLILEIQL